jgi:rubredoxin
VARISDKYQCTICGYIYEPTIGDFDSVIATGTPFKELPDDWIYLQCGAMKNEFKAL